MGVTMISMPLEDIKSKIIETAKISEAELDSKIKSKLDQLSGLISKEGAAHIIANELGVKLFEQTSGKLQIKNILKGMRDVETVGKIMRKFDLREFNVNGRNGKVCNMLIQDETGAIKVVGWGNKAEELSKINQGDIIKIKSGYIKENQGFREIHLNDRSSIVVNPEGENINVVQKEQTSEKPQLERKNISELTEQSSNVELFGTIVQTFDPKFFEVCPQCGKRAKQTEEGFACMTHNIVTPDYSYVLNLVLDDGTETIRTVFFRQTIEQLLNKSKEEVLGYKENPQSFETVKNELLGKQIKIAGRVTKNALFDRMEFTVNNVDSNPSPQEELKKIEQS